MSDDKMAQRQMQIDKIIDNLAQSSTGMELLRRSLEKAGMGLMQVVAAGSFPEVTDPDRVANARRGVILDVETTGLDTDEDEIIELAMVEIFFDEEGIISIGRIFDEFNEPRKKRIDEEVMALTGITNEMVAGHHINPAEVRDFVDGCERALAHNAAFDRKMVETNLPDCGFEGMAWHCTVKEVQWIKRGKSGRSLEVLALSEGLVYGSHRADADCIATAFVLNSRDENGRTAFAEMLEKGSVDTILVIADKSPFHSKDAMKDRKERDYNWSADGKEAQGYKAWWTEVPATEEDLAKEAAFLRDEVYNADKALPAYRIDATVRYSARKPGEKIFFRTAEAKDLATAARQMDMEEQMGFNI